MQGLTISISRLYSGKVSFAVLFPDRTTAGDKFYVENAAKRIRRLDVDVADANDVLKRQPLLPITNYLQIGNDWDAGLSVTTFGNFEKGLCAQSDKNSQNILTHFGLH